MNYLKYILFTGVVFSFIFSFNSKVHAGTDCKMDFMLKSWSLIYKSGKGSGTIKCDNGQKAKVGLKADGGGFTIGKSKVRGHGNFSEVNDISELYGNYAGAEAHAGVVESGQAKAMTKGEVSFSYAADGKGVDIGVAFGNFKIYPLK